MRKIAPCLVICLGLMLLNRGTALAQDVVPPRECGAAELMQAAFLKNPSLKDSLEKIEKNIRSAVQLRKSGATREQSIMTIPVVFHIVLTDPTIVTDAQVQAQLDVINADYAGTNSDASKLPTAFQSIFGNSGIRFCLAQRTPDGTATTGIVRYVTSKSSYAVSDNTLKSSASGGADAWNTQKYINVWICNLSGGYLGYGTFPGTTSSTLQGVVIDYGTVPDGVLPPYNEGRTLTHELGHFFDLYHIWGDDDGACTGSDDIDDTPNQADATAGCPNVTVKTDACTTTAPGILYENYMDYTDDACMIMFTKDQVDRMEATLTTTRASLLTSDGCTPVLTNSLDAVIANVIEPSGRVCENSVTPSITLLNRGLQTLTSIDILATLDSGDEITTHWTGSLASLSSTAVALTSMGVSEGSHLLAISLENPNGGTDEDPSTDTISTIFQYYLPVAPPITEGFESSTFPPQGWDIINSDGDYGWERVTGIAKTGNASVVIRNYNYQLEGAKDYLRLPEVTITNADSAFLSFEVAAAVQSNPELLGETWDTLEVMVSADCGKTYTSLYKKYGGDLVTRDVATTSSFVPASDEWRRDSINLADYINAGPLLFAFVNTNGSQNNIYLDDINLYQVTVNPNLKSSGFLVTPSPTTGLVTVQFYPTPSTLQGVVLFNAAGQRVAERQVNASNPVSNYYQFDLSRYASGVYIVRAVFSDHVETKRVVKL